MLPRFAVAFEVIVVDDGSHDKTAALVRKRAADHPEIRLEQHPHNLGYGHALRTGLSAAQGDVVFFTDADHQFRIADLERLLVELPNADIVAGYREQRSDPWHRLLVAWVYHKVLRALFGLRLRDVDCAFKVVRRSALNDVLDSLKSRSAFISPELLIRANAAGSRIVEVGIPHYPRLAGRSKGATPKVIARTLVEIARARRDLSFSRHGRSSTDTRGSST